MELNFRHVSKAFDKHLFLYFLSTKLEALGNNNIEKTITIRIRNGNFHHFFFFFLDHFKHE